MALSPTQPIGDAVQDVAGDFEIPHDLSWQFCFAWGCAIAALSGNADGLASMRALDGVDWYPSIYRDACRVLAEGLSDLGCKEK